MSPLEYHGTEIEDAYYHDTKLDYIYYHGTMVYEATVYVAKPTVASGSFTFDNTAKTLAVNGYNSNAMTQSGTTSATVAGTYTATYTLKRGYAWADGSTAPVNLTWLIAKRSLTVPSLSNTSYTWAVSKTFAPTVNGFNSTYESQGGTASSTSAGTFTVTWSLRYPDSTTWSDGTTGTKSATWSVSKLSLAAPSISSSRSFAFIEGTTRYVTISGYNSTYETQSGTTSTSALGSYTITWALRYPANTQWSDGSITNKSASWAINWVNGTSHYSNDIYNRGWSSGHIAIQSGASVTYGNETITVNSDGTRTAVFVADYAITGTFHVEVYVPSGNVGNAYLVETESASTFSGTTWQDGTGYTNTKGSWVEIYGAHKTSRQYFGARVGQTLNGSNGSQIRRIWVT